MLVLVFCQLDHVRLMGQMLGRLPPKILKNRNRTAEAVRFLFLSMANGFLVPYIDPTKDNLSRAPTFSINRSGSAGVQSDVGGSIWGTNNSTLFTETISTSSWNRICFITARYQIDSNAAQDIGINLGQSYTAPFSIGCGSKSGTFGYTNSPNLGFWAISFTLEITRTLIILRGTGSGYWNGSQYCTNNYSATCKITVSGWSE